jgi:lycopene cyclase domain-containing protein
MFGHATYLIFELGWALPVIVLHWCLGGRRLRARLPLIITVTAMATCYLTLADGVAIGLGIWQLHADRLLGPRLVDVPIEETVFFFTSNLMVVQSLIILRPIRLLERQDRTAGPREEMGAR